MIYILFIGILILFFISFFLFKKNILNPSVILCSVFLVSLFFSILNVKKWRIVFYLNTVSVILGTIIVFILGNSIIYLLPQNTKINKKNLIKKKIQIKKIPFKIIFLINLLSLTLLYKNFQEVYQLSLIGGNPGGYNLMLYYARNAKSLFFTLSRLITYGSYFVKAVAYICFFLFSYLTIFDKFKIKNLFLLFSVIIYCCFIILSTGRTEFIYLLIYILVTFFILYQQKYNFKVTKKIIFYGILTLIIFFIIFILTGLFTGKTQASKNIFEMLSIYAGSSLPAFNIYMNNSTKTLDTYFGENTLFLIYDILRKLNYGIPKLYIPYEFIYFGEIYTNIYGAIRRYYEDFGIGGLFIIVFLLGIFYGVFFNFASYKKNNFFVLILYASFCFPIFEFPIEERFFMLLFPQGFIYNFIALGITYYFLIYKNMKKEK